MGATDAERAGTGDETMYAVTTGRFDEPGLTMDGLDGGGLATTGDAGFYEELNLSAMCSVCGCRHDIPGEPATPDLFKQAAETSVPPIFMADDYAGDTTTAGVLTLGTPQTGSVEASFDEDWFAFEVTEGTTYVFNLDADTSNGNALIDTYLRLLDSNGVQLDLNDDANGTRFAELTYTATATTTVYVSAQAWSNLTGDYVLSVAESVPPPPPDPIDPADAEAVAMGGRVTGTLEAAGEVDVFAIEVQAGQDYTIFLVRDTEDALQNPFLNLFDADGNYLTGSDDVAEFDWNARLDFTATETGTLYLSASSSDGVSSNLDEFITVDPTGGYTLLVEEADERADFTSDDVANYLVNSFSPFANVWDSTTITVDLNALPGPAQTIARMALQAWADLAPLNFVEVAAGEVANITFQDTELGRAYATSLGPNGGNQVTINVASNWSGGLAVDPDTGELDDDPFANVDDYTFQTYVHEVGHALGLGHGGAYNAGNGNPISYADSRVYNQDTWTTTVMSYFSQAQAGVGDFRFVLGPQIADIIAIQSLYGVNTTTRDGNTVYGWNTTEVGSVYDFSQYDNQPPAITIYDAGGTDLLDFSGFSGNQIIDLNVEERSTIGGVNGSAALANILNIARGTVIENAYGGTGNDMLRGNMVANTLRGLAGDDVIEGGDGEDNLVGDAGNDTIRGGQDDDRLMGGEGNDTLIGNNGDDVAVGGLGNDIVLGGNGNDSLYGNEGNDTLNGEAGNDRLIDGAGDDLLIGGAGDDLAIGGEGADRLYGNEGHDTLKGGAGNDRLIDGAGNDLLIGGAGDDVAIGGAGNDRLYGNDGNDVLNGGTGNDRLIDGEGDDLLLGGDGDDLAIGGAGNDRLYGQNGNDVLKGEDGNDRLIDADGDDSLFGGAGDDLLIGGVGNDRLFGGEDNDILKGDAGFDRLDGGSGTNQLFGGAGADVFTRSGDGTDIIRDFTQGEDLIELDDSLADFDDLLANATDTAGGLRIDNGDSGVFIIQGMTRDSIAESDFLFADDGQLVG